MCLHAPETLPMQVNLTSVLATRCFRQMTNPPTAKLDGRSLAAEDGTRMLSSEAA